MKLKTSNHQTAWYFAAEKRKFSTKDFFSKCDQILRKLRVWSHLRTKSLMENLIFSASVQELPNSANSLSHFYLSLIALRKDTGCQQVLKKDIIKCFWRTCLKLVFLQSTIREAQVWNRVLGVKISITVTKLDYRWSLITSIQLYQNKSHVL